MIAIFDQKDGHIHELDAPYKNYRKYKEKEQKEVKEEVKNDFSEYSKIVDEFFEKLKKEEDQD